MSETTYFSLISGMLCFSRTITKSPSSILFQSMFALFIESPFAFKTNRELVSLVGSNDRDTFKYHSIVLSANAVGVQQFASHMIGRDMRPIPSSLGSQSSSSLRPDR